MKTIIIVIMLITVVLGLAYYFLRPLVKQYFPPQQEVEHE